MKLIDSSGKHAWFELWTCFPPLTWKCIKMYWDFAELINLKISISWTISASIEFWLPFGKLMFGWSTSDYTRDTPYFEFKLFHQRKSTDEILADDGWVTIDKSLKYNVCPDTCERCPGAEIDCTEEDALRFKMKGNQLL